MMKLYYAPGACSLSDHIALLEVGAKFEAEPVDLHTKRTASGEDFNTINPKGYVPALVLDDCEVLTENVAILDWLSEQYPQLLRNGTLSRTRQLEMLAFIATEIHHTFEPMWHAGAEEELRKAREKVAKLLGFAATQMRGLYLFGDELCAADCYLFVMVRWAEKLGVAIPDALLSFQWRMLERPAVQAALAREEISVPRKSSTISPDSANSRVRENPREHRFERPIHDDAIAAAYYRDEGGKLVFIHTEVPPEFEGLGIGTDLAHGTFELVRETGRKAVLVCPFMVEYAATHPEFADVVVGEG